MLKSFSRVVPKDPLNAIFSRNISSNSMKQVCGFTDDQLLLHDTVKKFANEKISPLAAQTDATDIFPRHIWPEIGGLGLHGITCSSEYGGSDLTYTTHCMIMEEFSRASASIGGSYGAHSNLCMNLIDKNANHSQKMKYLPKLCTGEHVGALAMSEPGAGSDVVSMKTTAVKKDGRWILNGTKFWITNGPVADIIVLYAKTDLQAGPKGITAFIIEKKFKGFSVGKKLDKLGLRGSETGELILENCEVPEENVLGQVNKGVYVLMSGLDIERLILGAGSIGYKYINDFICSIMQACFDLMMGYVTQREQFNKKIGEFQLMQAKIAEVYTRLQASRSYLYSLAKSADKGKVSNTDCASAFFMASSSSVKVALECVQALGGNGYINDYPAARLLRDSKLYDIAGGSVEIRKWLIGRELFEYYKKSN